MKKALDVARRTGDRVILVDDSNNWNADAFVVMNIDEYEKMLSSQEGYDAGIRGLTEDELIDKINRDIALWKEEEQERGVDEIEEVDGHPEEEWEEESMYYYPEKQSEGHPEEERVFTKFHREQKEFHDKQSEEKEGNDWKIPFDVKAAADEVK